MKKYGLLILAAILLIAIILLIPTIQGFFAPEAPASVYEDFGAFIPYTMGYFPEDFTITRAGTDKINSDGLDQFEEWYGAEDFFIQLIQGKGQDVIPWGSGYALTKSLLIQEQPAEIIPIEDPASLVSTDFDISNYDLSSTMMLTFFIEDIRIQVLSNLPEGELVQVAENLIPSICVNPTKISP